MCVCERERKIEAIQRLAIGEGDVLFAVAIPLQLCVPVSCVRLQLRVEFLFKLRLVLGCEIEYMLQRRRRFRM